MARVTSSQRSLAKKVRKPIHNRSSLQLVKKIPEHLHPLIATQNSQLYTAIDHASWRFIQLLSRDFFPNYAHQVYLDGLEATGISKDHIPSISDMDRKLQRFGWRAVPVVGFIPPNAFLEFLSLAILPIACDMRRLDHLSYTPAPDIVHEAAGHAPILADPSYANYLKHYGEFARKVIFSDKDMDLYNAIRKLSDVKEDPSSSNKDIQKAQEELDKASSAVIEISEATQLSRMGWWTFEYGLVGTLKNPKIYGAGLLSSVAEGYHAMSSAVKKVPMSLDCINVSYDITKPQPQLFVTPDFDFLTEVLFEFANTLAYKKGGVEGLEKAIRCGTVNTAELNTGLQISGKFCEAVRDDWGRVCYIRTEGPTQLAYQDRELSGHGPSYHAQGFGSPVGKYKETKIKDKIRLEFDSGVAVEGRLLSKTKKNNKTLLLSFKDCTVKKDNRVLFAPEWGTFDMAIGQEVKSVFGGPADSEHFISATGGFKPSKGQKSNLTPDNKELNTLYAQIRKLRETGPDNLMPVLKQVHQKLNLNHKNDWLLRFEILELTAREDVRDNQLVSEIKQELKAISQSSKDKAELIERGLALL
ncbi:MAG: aromatic amino acid hydroxylase [Bacteriovoracia bacterium]